MQKVFELLRILLYTMYEVTFVKKTARCFDPRQSMHRPDFEVFHYQDPKMQEVPLHHHDFYEVYFFLSGKVDYLVEGRSYTLLPDDILLISPMELHRPNVAPEEAYERIVLWIRAETLAALSDEASPLTACFGTGQNRFHAGHTPIPALMRQLAQEAVSEQRGSALCARGLLLQLMAEILRLTERGGQAPGTREAPLIDRVLRYIGEHYREELSLDSLAAEFFVSKYYLSHLFSRTVGTGVYRYIILKRLQHARQMLAEGGSPGEVCLSCGFQDYANFYRSFKEVYGVSPQQAAGRAE